MLFAPCEIFQRISNAFDEISATVEQLSWYRYPKDIQQTLPMVFMATQQPIEFECFGSISCNRKTFTMVRLNKLRSYIDTFPSFNGTSLFLDN